MKRSLRVAGLAAAPVVAALLAQSAQTQAQAVPCAVPVQLIEIQVPTGLASRNWFAMECLAKGETLSSARIHWGDGSTTPGLVAYEPPDSAGYVTALVFGSHAYTRANCTSLRACRRPYTAFATAIDDQTGKSISGGNMEVAVTRPASSRP